jgi:hypothetical protein
VSKKKNWGPGDYYISGARAEPAFGALRSRTRTTHWWQPPDLSLPPAGGPSGVQEPPRNTEGLPLFSRGAASSFLFIPPPQMSCAGQRPVVGPCRWAWAGVLWVRPGFIGCERSAGEVRTCFEPACRCYVEEFQRECRWCPGSCSGHQHPMRIRLGSKRCLSSACC